METRRQKALYLDFAGVLRAVQQRHFALHIFGFLDDLQRRLGKFARGGFLRELVVLQLLVLQRFGTRSSSLLFFVCGL